MARLIDLSDPDIACFIRFSTEYKPSFRIVPIYFTIFPSLRFFSILIVRSKFFVNDDYER